MRLASLTGNLKHPPSASLWRKAGALLCVLLLAALTTVAVAHIHHDAADGPSDAHCQLCQLSHSPSAITSQVAALLYIALTALLVCLARPTWMGRVAVRDISTRPPPAAL